MIEGQYTLESDPLVLAKRVETLERAVDGLCAALCDIAKEVRVVAYECDKALCEDRPLQAAQLGEVNERLSRIYQTAHAVGVTMGRSY